tara:strand:+ start:20 stop:235 length:216 start_codon:yes stop_codon:yes gene_type:complete
MDKVLAFAMFITLDGETILHRHFKTINECRYAAQELGKEQSFYEPIEAICKPKLVDKKLIEMYYEAQKKND